MQDYFADLSLPYTVDGVRRSPTARAGRCVPTSSIPIDSLDVLNGNCQVKWQLSSDRNWLTHTRDSVHIVDLHFEIDYFDLRAVMENLACTLKGGGP